jgi:hypothetical protein
MVRSATPDQLMRRPPSGAWSAYENVRHLLFAERRHFDPWLKSDPAIRKLGMPKRGAKGETRFSATGIGPDGRLEDVLAEWATVHKAVRALFDAPVPALDRQLGGNLQHFNQHLRMIEELLSA